MKKFPNDPDGRTLELMQKQGANFLKEHGIEFFLYFQDEKSSITARERLVKYGFEVEISKNENNSDWFCLATIKINPGYFALNRFRQKFEKIAIELNGTYDGWGTLIE